MKAFKIKTKKLQGSKFSIVNKKATQFYREIKNKTKRRPYVRSVYFNKDKVFINLFWEHLFIKENWRDRTRRLKFFPAAIELIRNTRFDPISKENPNKREEILHRFAGITGDNHQFYVQIKEDKRKGQKWLISFFPEDE
ncbi:MAG: hypothetical protein Q8P32_05150 [Candidatus Komeilibacteria bacterium]|nr:hypothetical protein [Candidatus Komeilibacteria bacterium]